MDYERIETLRQSDPALRLLRADNLSFIAGFLHFAFLKTNKRSLPFSELEFLLEDYLLGLRRNLGEAALPRTAKQYLDEWSQPGTAFLRKFYEAQEDEAYYDLTPPVERALAWLRESLEEKAFVGTESRMLTLFQLLREFILLTERDPQTRIRELEYERSKIDQEIERVRSGQFSPLSPTQAKERFYQIEDTARRLLSDFRQIEENFRKLDRATRERIALSEKTKGVVLDAVFGEQEVIWSSEQGKSFRAFWEFLMSSTRQDEMDAMLSAIFGKADVKSFAPDPFLQSIRFLLLEAADKVYRSNGLLIEQLRKFLDDRNQFETRRISDLIRAIEKQAIELKSTVDPNFPAMTMNETKATIDLVMSRGLFLPPSKPVITSERLQIGTSTEAGDSLFQQVVVDERELKQNVIELLKAHSQVSLRTVLERFPPRYGLAEVVIYFKIATNDSRAFIDDSCEETLVVTGTDGKQKKIISPRVIFTRTNQAGRGL
jgi:hypothetical protein